MATITSPATKQDVEKIVGQVVGEVVGEVVGDAMQTISDHIDRKFAEMGKRFDRLEDKIETIGATVEHHAIDIRELQRKTT